MVRQRPWASLVLFFLVLAAASGGLEWWLISLHEPIERHLALALALMWVPAGVRLTSGSVWPAIVGHAAWNAAIQGVFDRSTTMQIGVHWVGEDGILVALFALVGAIAFTLRRQQPLLAPGKPLASPSAAS